MDSTLAKLTVVAVDDDDLALSLLESVLINEGFEVFTTTDSETAIKLIEEKRPAVVLSDLMMPNVDGFELCKQVREHPELNETKFVVISAKAYHSDENRARDLGANGFIRKPIDPETMPDRLRRIVNDQIDLQFWGVRGTLPKTGADALKYGGNTSCVTLEFPNQQLFIFDGGSGIKQLGAQLMADKRQRINGKLFISHPHWDHINAIPSLPRCMCKETNLRFWVQNRVTSQCGN